MSSFTLEAAERQAPWRCLRLVAPCSATLDALAQLLARELGRAPDDPAAFYRSARAFDARTEFSSLEGSDHPMQGVRLDRFALRPGARFLYLCESAPPTAVELTVTGVAEEESELAVLERRTPGSPAEIPLFARLRAALEPAPDDEDAASRATRLTSALALAHELLGLGHDEILVLCETRSLDLENWLIELPFDLARAGLVDEAAALAARAAEVIDFPDLLADRAVILAQAGRRPEAETQAQAILANPSSGAVQLAKCGDVFRVLGELAQAEELYQKAMPRVGSTYELELVRERLVALLTSQGRDGEARALALALEARSTDAFAPDEPLEGEPLDDELFPRPRVGRNDPCPCGSGKKYKKCCAREASAAPRERARLGPAVERALESLLASRHAASLRTEIARFAGPVFEGLDLPEALPLLPEEQAERAYLDWWLIDRPESEGRTPLELFLEKRARKLDLREARALARLANSTFGLHRVGPETGAARRVEDVLEGGVRSVRSDEPLGREGAYVLARFSEVDGHASLVHEGIPVRSEHAAAIEHALGPRWASLARHERAPALFQAWLDALHAPLA